MKKKRTKNIRSLPVAMILVLLYTSVLLYYYCKNKARETPTSGCACAHPRVPSVGTWSTAQHTQKHPKKGRETPTSGFTCATQENPFDVT